MIRICPFCGHKLKNAISDGITTCCNCERIFDVSRKNYLLSVSWMVRKFHIPIETIDLSDEDKKIIQEFVIEKDMSHDEFLKVIRSID